MKKKIFLFIISLLVSTCLFSQVTKRDVDIIKSNAQVNFNNDVTITNSSTNNLVVSGGVFTADAGITVDGTSGLVISKLILKDSKLTAISSSGDTLTFYTSVANRADGDNYYVGFSQGTGAPTSTPSRIGLLYYDTVNDKLYYSGDTTSSADWVILN